MPQLESDDFVECYQLHYPRLVRALGLAGAPEAIAEDLAQEAFARMLTHWRRVRTGASPAGYAYRTGFRLLHRSRRVRRTIVLTTGDRQSLDRPVDGAPIPGPSTGGPGPPWRSVEGPEGLVTSRAAVAGALASMPPRRRACAVMCLVVGLPTSAAASALGITEGTVRKHVGEARDDLRQALGRDR